MKGWIAGLAPVLLLAACDSAAGARSECAYGGELVACPEAERTPEGACWRLVDCAAIPIKNANGNFDWGKCVDRIDTRIESVQREIIDCIAVSTCDELKVDGSPDDPNIGELYCGFGAL